MLSNTPPAECGIQTLFPPQLETNRHFVSSDFYCQILSVTALKTQKLFSQEGPPFKIWDLHPLWMKEKKSVHVDKARPLSLDIPLTSTANSSATRSLSLVQTQCQLKIVQRRQVTIVLITGINHSQFNNWFNSSLSSQ